VRGKIGSFVDQPFNARQITDPIEHDLFKIVADREKPSWKRLALLVFTVRASRTAAFGRDNCKTLAEMEAFAQNLGHESATTTFGSYARVSQDEQRRLVRSIGKAV
jgi:hypothetical protein